jgi:serine/threonine-protein kinase RsbW
MQASKRTSLQIDSRPECVTLVATWIRDLCAEIGIDQTQALQIQTAVVEAVNNSILHAYGGQPGYRVTVDWTWQDQQVSIEVTDQGVGMQALPPDIEPHPEAESGRGWWIMRRWMDRVDYSCSNGFNRLVMTRRLVPL